MIRRPPISTRTDTLFPYTTHFRSIRTDSFRWALGVSARRGQPPPDQVFRVSGDTSPLILRRAVIRRVRGVGTSWNWRGVCPVKRLNSRSEEHTSELQSLMRISYAVFCLKKKTKNKTKQHTHTTNYKKTT